MTFLRWILGAPIAVTLLVVLAYVCEWILGFILKIAYFIMVWGTRFDTPPIFDFEASLQDFKSFIFITCLSPLIAGGISGYIGGKICPPNNPNATMWLMGVFICIVAIISSITFWTNEHWFYSILWVIDMVIMSIIFIGSAGVAAEKD